MLKRPMQLAAVTAMALLGDPVLAQQKWPHMPTASEIALMPEYCQAKMGSNAELSQKWNQRMGPDKYMHLHHYCHGLKQMNRAKFTFETQQRRYILQTAVNEFDYVLRNWPDGFELKAEAKARKLEAQNKLQLL